MSAAPCRIIRLEARVHVELLSASALQANDCKCPLSQPLDSESCGGSFSLSTELQKGLAQRR
jgi:hypothetical protein